MNIVWFKRDLRLHDHSALNQAHEASKGGPLLCLYILEPELWAQTDMSGRHYAFLTECLTALATALSKHGQNLILKVGEAVDVLAPCIKFSPFMAFGPIRKPGMDGLMGGIRLSIHGPKPIRSPGMNPHKMG